ncbi:hypothetical protein T06_7696 [Trichinella sp. T6]|nr:hypothetical protein T06_7696 [Trichinella sp. T6]
MGFFKSNYNQLQNQMYNCWSAEVEAEAIEVLNSGVAKMVNIDPLGSMGLSKGSIIAILSKQRNRLNLEMRGDLRLKLTNFQPNINALVTAHQTHPSH